MELTKFFALLLLRGESARTPLFRLRNTDYNMSVFLVSFLWGETPIWGAQVPHPDWAGKSR
jgi:hypothetical protein